MAALFPMPLDDIAKLPLPQKSFVQTYNKDIHMLSNIFTVFSIMIFLSNFPSTPLAFSENIFLNSGLSYIFFTASSICASLSYSTKNPVFPFLMTSGFHPTLVVITGTHCDKHSRRVCDRPS